MATMARALVRAGLRRLVGQMVDWLVTYAAPPGAVERFRVTVTAAIDEALQEAEGGPNGQ
jgi:hypothetical protein